MKIIVYSETTASTVAGNLGQPEYSYYFILEKYLPVLSVIAEVVFVSDPVTEVDVLYDAAARAGVLCVFLSFTPPHRTTMNL
ncbi:MAG: glycosyltransferase family 1 protein, partial [Gammaproteobacteria bacterium]|nr:glycosyltransferase family 1 protein [Gammaproteobacteria bacterium]